MKKLVLIVFSLAMLNSNLSSFLSEELLKNAITKKYPKYSITHDGLTATLKIDTPDNQKDDITFWFSAFYWPNREKDITAKGLVLLEKKDFRNYRKVYILKAFLIRSWLEDQKDKIDSEDYSLLYFTYFDYLVKQGKKHIEISKKAFKKYTDIVIRTVV